MDLNFTLVGQMITFSVFVWFTMRFVWPPLQKAMEERRQKIAQGLEAAEQGHQALEKARETAKTEMETVKKEAATIIEQAGQRARQMIDEAKQEAREEGARLVSLAKGEIQQEYQSVKNQLMKDVSKIAIAGAEKILGREINASDNTTIIDDLAKEI